MGFCTFATDCIFLLRLQRAVGFRCHFVCEIVVSPSHDAAGRSRVKVRAPAGYAMSETARMDI